MRVVLDANILVRAVSSPYGPAGKLFEQLLCGHLLISSPELLAELSRTLAYDRLKKHHGLDDEEVNRFVDKVALGSLVVSLSPAVPRVVPADIDDDVVIAAAVAGLADRICTRNKHLQHTDVTDYCTARSIRIVDDLELLNELQALDDAGH